MEYEQKHKDDLEAAKGWLAIAKENNNKIAIQILEKFFPELAESEDEKSKKWILEYLYDGLRKSDEQFKGQFKTAVAWLEKQGEQKLCMIQWKGNNLKEVIGFTCKNKNFDKWFTSFEEYERYVHEHNNIFKLFNEDGSHYEVPVGAWIVKTPDGYNIASKAVLKQKLAEKVEPKFKVGDWITNGEYTWKIKDIKPLDYILKSQNGDIIDDNISYVDENFRFWTIQDTKDGDVLAVDDSLIFIYNRCLCSHVVSYCRLINLKFDAFKYARTIHEENRNIQPATKEQRDLLLQKMKEAGYEWDAEKKKLKKIEQKPVDKIEQKSSCSEEDEEIHQKASDIAKEAVERGFDGTIAYYAVRDMAKWLKSLKPRWKPTEEQMKALKEACDEHWEPDGLDPLYTLYENLLKL